MSLIVAITKQQRMKKFPRIGEFYVAKPHSYFSNKYQLLFQIDPGTFEKLSEQYADCSEDRPLCLIPKHDVTIVNKV
jgi:hypothetical protein